MARLGKSIIARASQVLRRTTFGGHDDPARANNRGEYEPGWRQYGWLFMSPAESREAMAIEPHDMIPTDVLIATQRTKEGYSAEIAVPHAVLDRMHGGSPGTLCAST